MEPKLQHMIAVARQKAFDEGHRQGFENGKKQRDHDIQRAIDEWKRTGEGDSDYLIVLLKKYTEA